jgi:cyclase
MSEFKRPRLIPVILLEGKGLVKTVKFDERKYIGDPINTVKIFNSKGVDELCVLDIDATRNNRPPNFELLKDIATEAFMPLSYGGGITSISQIQELLKLGYEKVIINSVVHSDPNLITEAANFAGSQSIVVSIDYKDKLGKNVPYTKCGTLKVKESLVDLAKRAQSLGAGEILLGAISRDGTMKGYDLNAIEQVSSAVSIPVIAVHGAKDATDMKKALDAGASAVAAGSMYVYYGTHKAVLISAPREDNLFELGIYVDN